MVRLLLSIQIWDTIDTTTMPLMTTEWKTQIIIMVVVVEEWYFVLYAAVSVSYFALFSVANATPEMEDLTRKL